MSHLQRYGYYCNCFRKEAFEILLRFGAQAGMRDGNNASVIDIINEHPEHRRDDFMKLIRQYHGQKPQVARVCSIITLYFVLHFAILGSSGKVKK